MEVNNEAVRPWPRLFARMIDHVLYAMIAVVLAMILNIEGLLMYLLVFGSIILSEDFFSPTGVTPGKWIFAVQVKSKFPKTRFCRSRKTDVESYS